MLRALIGQLVPAVSPPLIRMLQSTLALGLEAKGARRPLPEAAKL